MEMKTGFGGIRLELLQLLMDLVAAIAPPEPDDRGW
jgi:hypothetical protein